MKHFLMIAILALLLAAPSFAANELKVTGTPATSVYFCELSPTGQWYNAVTPAFENETDADAADYAIAATEQGTTPMFVASQPSAITTPGSYTILAYQEATPGTANPLTDTYIGQGTLNWSGTAEITLAGGVPLASGQNVATVGGQSPPTNWSSFTAAPTTTSIIDALMGRNIDPLGTLTFQDLLSDIWDSNCGPTGTITYTSTTQTTPYLRADGTTVAYTSTLSQNSNSKNVSRARTNGTRP